MRTVPFIDALTAASVLWDGKESPDVRTSAQLRLFLNRRAPQMWEQFPWPEWTRIERRFFAPAYGTVSNATPQVVYYGPPDGYYQALVRSDVINTPPATESGGVFTTDPTWALLPVCDDLEEWDSTESYDTPDRVVHPTSRRRFQAVGANSAVEPGAASGWEDYWGEIFDFFRGVSLDQDVQTPIGECFKAYNSDPRALCGCRPQELHRENIREGILIKADVTSAWLKFRERAPSWTGEPYAAPTTYAEDDQAWDPDTGDFYKSLQDDNTGHDVTDADWWEVVPFPYVLRDAAPQAAYADMLRLDGQHEKVRGEEQEAFRLLRREFDKLERQQGQTAPLPVRTRC